jgi:hypothetical protein
MIMKAKDGRVFEVCASMTGNYIEEEGYERACRFIRGHSREWWSDERKLQELQKEVDKHNASLPFGTF